MDLENTNREPLSSFHLQNLLGGFISQILFLFLASYFWFPSDARRGGATETEIAGYVALGTGVYLLGVVVSLILLYRASEGGLTCYPDMVRKSVLALFAFFHFDKIPILVAYLLIYSPETGMIYPKNAAVALAAYIPVALFLYLVSKKIEPSA